MRRGCRVQSRAPVGHCCHGRVELGILASGYFDETSGGQRAFFLPCMPSSTLQKKSTENLTPTKRSSQQVTNRHSGGQRRRRFTRSQTAPRCPQAMRLCDATTTANCKQETPDFRTPNPPGLKATHHTLQHSQLPIVMPLSSNTEASRSEPAELNLECSKLAQGRRRTHRITRCGSPQLHRDSESQEDAGNIVLYEYSWMKTMTDSTSVKETGANHHCHDRHQHHHENQHRRKPEVLRFLACSPASSQRAGSQPRRSQGAPNQKHEA